MNVRREGRRQDEGNGRVIGTEGRDRDVREGRGQDEGRGRDIGREVSGQDMAREKEKTGMGGL